MKVLSPRLVLGLLAPLLFLGVSAAHADISKKVQAAFRGQILVSSAPLPDDGGGDKETIALYKKNALSTITGVGEDGSKRWSFVVTAFFRSPPKVDELSLDFYLDDKERSYVANKKLLGINGSLTVLITDIALTEDDGLNPKRNYIVKLAGRVKGKEVVFAQTKLATK